MQESSKELIKLQGQLLKFAELSKTGVFSPEEVKAGKEMIGQTLFALSCDRDIGIAFGRWAKCEARAFLSSITPNTSESERDKQ